LSPIFPAARPLVYDIISFSYFEIPLLYFLCAAASFRSGSSCHRVRAFFRSASSFASSKIIGSLL
jgi:hypothetical protein